MSKLPTIIYSNRLEILADHLKKALFSQTSFPFAKRTLVVPSAAMRSWLWQRIAKGEEGIVAGVEGRFLHPTLHHLAYQLLEGERPSLPTQLVLSLAIEQALKKKMMELSEAHSPNVEEWQPLLRYLKVEKNPNAKFFLSRKGERRIVALSRQLAELFTLYGEYGGELIPVLEGKSTGWQQQLWRILFSSERCWDYPRRLFERAIAKLPEVAGRLQDKQVHLFGLSFFSSIHHRFLSHLAAYMPVTYYMLSPCAAYWDDVCSQQDSTRIRAKGELKGVSLRQREMLETLLQEHNPLLANWGRVGREMALRLQEGPCHSVEDYRLAASIKGLAPYQELLHPAISEMENGLPPTLLQTVQTDLLLMSSPNEEAKVSFLPTDRSIQVHVAATRLREIQILYEVILNLMDKHAGDADPIMPKDIVVMAPRISAYLPLIKQVFSKQDRFLDVQVYDLDLGQNSSLTIAYLKLLSLTTSRWEGSTLLSLFEIPLFRQKQGLNAEEIAQWRTWVEELSISWGKDADHRNELLLRDHCSQGVAKNYEGGTWEHGISQLLEGLVKEREGGGLLTYSQSPLLQKWIGLIRSLKEDLRPLEDGSLMTLGEWSTYLKCLLESYFHQDSNEEWEELTSQLDLFSKAGRNSHLSQEKFSFITIRQHLEECLKGCHLVHHGHHLQAVQFCSMLPMRAIPAKVVYLIGLDDESYPRQGVKQPFNLMQKLNTGDYLPSQGDYDRYLFLEAILSARSYLCLSYVGKSATGEKDLAPSSLILELLAYLENGCCIDGISILDHLVVKHPYYPFDKRYFNASSDAYKSYSQNHYRAAKAYYRTEKQDSHRFLPQLYLEQPCLPKPVPTKEKVIDLKLLNQISRHPLKAYLNHRLGLYLDQNKEPTADKEENFTHSSLEMYHLRSAALGSSVEQVINRQKQQRCYPQGIFGEVATKRLGQECYREKQQLETLALNSNDIYSVKLDLSCDKPTQIGEHEWIAPALSISYQKKELKLIGTINNVTPQGIMSRGKYQLADLAKIWPQYLVGCCMSPLPFQVESKTVLFLKDGKLFSSEGKDVMALLKEFIDYSQLALQTPSPLAPEWIHAFLTRDPKRIQQAVDASFSQWIEKSDSHYLPYLMDRYCLPDPISLISVWSPLAEKIFFSLPEELKK